MAWRYVHLTGCAHADLLTVPVFGGEAEIIRMLPAEPLKGYLVAVHGFGCNRVFPNRPIYQMFLERGIGVISLPLPGHHPTAPPFAAPWLTAYVPSILNTLAPRLNAPVIAAQGNSWGAILALSAMPEIPTIKLGVFLEPPLQVAIGYAELCREIMGSLNRHLVGAAGEMPLRVLWEMARGRCRFQERDGNPAHRNFLHPRTLPELQKLLESLSLPLRLSELKDRSILFVGGERDRVATPNDIHRLASYIPGDSKVAIIPQANHTTLFFHPQTMPLIQTWLDEHLAKLLAPEPVINLGSSETGVPAR